MAGRCHRTDMPRSPGVFLILSLGAGAVFAQSPDSQPTLEISIAQRRLWVLSASGETLFTAPVAVGSGRTLRAGGRTWTFNTPVGETYVRAKEVEPLWIPPDWHYEELAKRLRLRTARIVDGHRVGVDDTTVLLVRDRTVGLVGPDSIFRALPEHEEIIFGRTLFIPPFGTRNRFVPGVLGPYRLLLRNGVGLHGTPDKASIGTAATHGCIRLQDEDITWLYERIPIGARVIIRR